MYWNDITRENAIENAKLNSNIRCIEIPVKTKKNKYTDCWIVTLDVLKLYIMSVATPFSSSWIVTLDVLKFSSAVSNISSVSVE